MLERLGFIRTRKPPHGSYRHVLILEPHQVIADLQAKGKISDEASLALKAHLVPAFCIARLFWIGSKNAYLWSVLKG